MARRRNHGDSVSVGSLLAHAIGLVVPHDQLRLTRIQMEWAAIAPAQLLAVTWPDRVRDHTLTIVVRNNQWLHEITYLRTGLTDRLLAQCPKLGVDKLRFRVGLVPERPPVRRPPPPPPVMSLPDEPAPDTLHALREIGDAGLRQVMANARMALTTRMRSRSY